MDREGGGLVNSVHDSTAHLAHRLCLAVSGAHLIAGGVEMQSARDSVHEIASRRSSSLVGVGPPGSRVSEAGQPSGRSVGAAAPTLRGVAEGRAQFGTQLMSCCQCGLNPMSTWIWRAGADSTRLTVRLGDSAADTTLAGAAAASWRHGDRTRRLARTARVPVRQQARQQANKGGVTQASS